MSLIQLKLVLILAVLQHCVSLASATSDRKQLKDVQVKIPLQIRARRFCTDADCIKTCPKDYELDSEQQYCRYQRSTCPPNYVRRQGSCVLLEVHCPPGSVREGNRCVVKSFECPPGYVLEGTNCVNSRYCPDGYRWENGFCYNQNHRSHVCPNGYERQSGVCVQICVNCEAACSECQEETIPLQCPTGYVLHREKCIKLLQGRADVIVRNVTYKVPKECENEEFYSDGSCVSWKFERIQCHSGHFYGGRCVSVATCNRGLLRNDCECIEESISPAVCQRGQPSSVGCQVEKAHCKASSHLLNGMCSEMVQSHKPFCEVGTLLNDIYCDVGSPQCPSGYNIDGSMCKSNVSYATQCETKSLFHGWCSTNANCENGYQLRSNGICVRNVISGITSCPSSTTESGKLCIYNLPLCDADYTFDVNYGFCVKCEEESISCNEESGYQYVNGSCLRYDSLCPPGYAWNKTQCIRTSEKLCQCKQGFHGEQFCIHSYLTCPENYHLVDGLCLKTETAKCSEGGNFLNGVCITSPQCPTGYISGPESCVEATTTRLNTTNPTCSSGFNYENGNCVNVIWRNAVSEIRKADCPFGYETAGELCIKKFYGYLVCPPKTILMNDDNKCFCKVDLVCPNGYERMGDECVFRSMNYFSSSLNFLNPCYGSQCGLQYCLTQCFTPPCPVQLCSYGAYYQQFNPLFFSSHGKSQPCGIGDDCTSYNEADTVVNLTCPPGYSKENNTCIAYYSRICQKGYKVQSGRCIRVEEIKPICPLGFTLVNATCQRVRCGAGFMRDGTRCKRLEYRSPQNCPRDHIFVHGFCLHKDDCTDGSIESNFCIKKRFQSFVCPRSYLLHNNTCIGPAHCSNNESTLSSTGCTSVKYITLSCPSGTRRVKNICVYPQQPICEHSQYFQKTSCMGEIKQDECFTSETPKCGKGFILKDDKCIRCSSKSPSCPTNMVIMDGRCIKLKSCKNGHILNRDGKCVSVDIKMSTCRKGTNYFGKCLDELPECHDGYTLENGNCVRIDAVAPTCRNGFLHQGRCVRLTRCKAPDFTLKNGWCVLHDYSDLECGTDRTRIRDTCIDGVPKCPDNYYSSEGNCRSLQVQSAECFNNGKCSDNFCSMSFPTCDPTFFFDGSVCKKMMVSAAKCPPGTTPDVKERSYCQYSSEHAESVCPAEYYFQNGICQKRIYAETSCPTGFRKKQNFCVRKTCNNPSLSNYCGQYDPLGSSDYPLGNHFPKSTHGTNSNEISKPTTAATPNQVCCQIFSPRICQYDNVEEEWSCYHTQHRRCGQFCSHAGQKIYLSTAQSYQFKSGVLIMKPADSDSDLDYNDDGEKSCDGCTDGSHDCDGYCYTYDCHEDDGGCNYMDQAEFCFKHPGAGCTSSDGCYDQQFCDP